MRAGAPAAVAARAFVGLAAVLIGAVLLGGCADDGSPPEPAALTTMPAPPVTTGPGATSPAEPPTGGEPSSPPASTTTSTVAPDGRLEDVAIALELVATLEAPTALTVRPGGTLLWVAERAGRVRVVDPASGALSAPVVDISDRTTTESERGLLGLAFTAGGDELVLSYTDRQGANVLDAWAVDEDGTLGAERRLLRVEQPAANHNGGAVQLGLDGYLYAGFGDGGGGGDPFGTGQDPGSLLATIIRIDPAGDPYAIPPDNPFVDGGGAPEVWLYGVRNPWRFSFDRATGDLWVADVGQGAVEEIDLLPAATGGGRGANLGWSEMEGSRPYEGGEEPADHVPPVYEYGHDEGCSVTGGHVYRGTAVPALVGSYVYSDYCAGGIRAVQVRDGGVVARDLGVAPEGGSVVSFGEGADGELYVLSLDGSLSRIVAA